MFRPLICSKKVIFLEPNTFLSKFRCLLHLSLVWHKYFCDVSRFFSLFLFFYFLKLLSFFLCFFIDKSVSSIKVFINLIFFIISSAGSLRFLGILRKPGKERSYLYSTVLFLPVQEHLDIYLQVINDYRLLLITAHEITRLLLDKI